MQTPQAVLLYRLQAIDTHIDKIRARLKAIDTALKDNAEVKAAGAALADAESALKPIEKRAALLDSERLILVSKIESEERRLYGGSIKVPKALSELQEEIAGMQRHASDLQDQTLELMLEIEERAAEIARLRAALAQAEADHAAKHADLIDEKAQLERDLASESAKREQAAAGIDASALKMYDSLRSRIRGAAVALMTGKECTACGVEQTSMVAQQVRQGHQIVYCGNCGRILAGSS